MAQKGYNYRFFLWVFSSGLWGALYLESLEEGVSAPNPLVKAHARAELARTGE